MSVSPFSRFKSRLKAELQPIFLGLGFERLPRSLLFVRRYGDVLHVLDFNKSKWGPDVYASAFAWVPEVEHPDRIRRDTLPRHLSSIVTGGRLSPRAVGDEWSWGFGSEDEISRSIDGIARSVIAKAEPWFATIRTRDDVLEVIDPGLEDRHADYAEFVARLRRPSRALDELGFAESPRQWETVVRVRYEELPELLAPIAERHLLPHGYDLTRTSLGWPRYVRESHGIFSIIEPQLLSNGVHVAFNVFPWMPELHDEFDDEPFSGQLPDDLWLVTGRVLGTAGLDDGGQSWTIGALDRRKELLEEVGTLIARDAVPWLRQLATKDDVVRAIKAQFRIGFDDRVAAVKEQLGIGSSEDSYFGRVRRRVRGQL
jgi:hypothetical protein